MGEVYRGWDTLLKQEVAIKVLLLQGGDATRQTEIERFLREVKIGRTLKHPHVVTVYDVGINPETDLPYIVMELINGKPLHALLEEKHLTIPEMVRIISEVAEALDYAAQSGVVHRDIKPSNILVDPESLAPKIVDFGVARVQGTDLTQTGTVLGTPCYMSPEQCLGQTVDGRSDLFSLGAVLYEMLANERTFPGDTIGTIIAGILDPAKPVRLRTLRPVIPASLDNVVMKALAKDPQDRFQRGKLFATALRAALSTAPPATLALQPGTFPALPIHQLGRPSSARIAEPGVRSSVEPKLGRPVSPERRLPAEKLSKWGQAVEAIQQTSEDQFWPGRALLLAWFIYIGIHHLADPLYVSLFGILNNIMHEGGHLLFRLSGNQFLGTAGGSILQLTVPLAAALVVFRQPDYFAVSVCGVWLATNLYNIAPYVADARTRILPLTTSDDGECGMCYDWQYLLSTMHLLPWDTKLAAVIRIIAFLFMWGAIAAGAWMVWLVAKSKS